MSTDTTTLVKGNFAQAWPIIISISGIALVFVAAGISFVYQGQMDIFYYPLLAGLVGLLISAIFVMRQGSFFLNAHSLVGKRRTGKPWSYPLSDIGQIKIGDLNTEIYDTDGKRLQSLPKVSPDRAPGAVWMYHHYREKLPKEALANIGQKYKKKNLPEGMFIASRHFKKPGSPTLTDYGTLVQYGDKFLYLPESRTESGGSALSMVSPVIVTRYIETPGIPNRMHLPIFPVVRDLHNLSLPNEDKVGYLGLMVMTHLGSSVTAADQQSEGGALVQCLEDGTEVTIEFS